MLDEDDVTLLDYWAVVRKRITSIGALVGAAVLAALVVSLLQKPIYVAKATILAPKEPAAGPGQALSAALAASGAAQLMGGFLSSNSNRDVFVSILKSDTVARDVVDRFDLRAYYRATFQTDAIKALQRETGISVSKEGAITVTTQHTVPKTAGEMANFYVEDLDRIFTRLGTTEASRQRTFIQERLEKTGADLRANEEALRRFQESNKAIVLQEQSKVAIEAAARIKGEIAAAEVQLQVLRTFATERNPDVVRLEKRVIEMKNELGKMQFGSGLDLPDGQDAGGRTRKELFVPAARVPQVALELARLMREVKIHETVFQLLTSQLEQTKISEARDMPVVQVLDRAFTPDRKSKPSIRLNVGIAGLLSAIVGICAAFFVEYVETARRRQRYGLSAARIPAVQGGGEQGLLQSERKPLVAPESTESVEEQNEAVDVRHVKLSWPGGDRGSQLVAGAGERPVGASRAPADKK